MRVRFFLRPSRFVFLLSIVYLASVFTRVRCQQGAIQVDPISARRFARSMFMKRVLPITFPEFFSLVRKATDSPRSGSASVYSTILLKSAGVFIA